MFNKTSSCVLVSLLAVLFLPVTVAAVGLSETFENSLGVRLVRIPAATFIMGSEKSDWDEEPVVPPENSYLFDL